MKYILTISDRRTRWLECVPLPAATSKNVCNGFIRGWLSRYGCRQRIFCDNGNTYQAGLWLDLNRVLGTEVTFVPPFHQQTNGAIERQHKTLKESIKASLVEMADTHREKCMQQLPYTLLGRRVSLQPDLGASPSDLVLGGGTVLPGVVMPESPESQCSEKQNSELLKSVQASIDTPVMPMSDHSGKQSYYTPKDMDSAMYVYLKLEKPDNLSKRYIGPYVIVDRPTNTTVQIRVGYDKKGFPRLETHSWDNLRIAHLRPDAQVAVRPDQGRKPASHLDELEKSKMADQETLFLPPNSNLSTNQGDATYRPKQITQPRTEGGGNQPYQPAALADSGYHTSIPTLPPQTGPPPFSFNQNKNNVSPDTILPEPGLEPGREPLPLEVNGGLAPPVTKGAPPQPNPLSTPAPSAGTTSAPSAEQTGHLHDHDYFQSRPSALSDHNYYQTLPRPEYQPNIGPPPGFKNYQTGRPVRNRNMPTRFNDYDLS